jgi:hypothetical protein
MNWVHLVCAGLASGALGFTAGALGPLGTARRRKALRAAFELGKSQAKAPTPSPGERRLLAVTLGATWQVQLKDAEALFGVIAQSHDLGTARGFARVGQKMLMAFRERHT